MGILADLIARHQEVSGTLTGRIDRKASPLVQSLFRGIDAGLKEAEWSGSLYWWDNDPLSVIQTVAPDLPDDWILEPWMVPQPSCFWAFPHPIRIIPDESYGPIDGLVWHTGFNLSRNRPMLILGFLLAPQLNQKLQVRGVDAISWDIGTPIADPEDNSESAPEKQLPPYTHRLTRFLAAALQFLQQELLVHEPLRPERADYRRAKNGTPPTGHLITVRHARYEKSDTPGSVDWAGRWLVRGHWRRLETRYTFVRPYVKGPEDKPLLVTQHGYHVRR